MIRFGSERFIFDKMRYTEKFKIVMKILFFSVVLIIIVIALTSLSLKSAIIFIAIAALPVSGIIWLTYHYIGDLSSNQVIIISGTVQKKEIKGKIDGPKFIIYINQHKYEISFLNDLSCKVGDVVEIRQAISSKEVIGFKKMPFRKETD